MTTLQALSEAKLLAAGKCGRLRGLAKLAESGILCPELFVQFIGQHPGTIGRDLNRADEDYRRLTSEYELHCAAIGEPAYATYND